MPRRFRRHVLLPALLLGAGCGLQTQNPAAIVAPGTALDAFKRDLGLRVVAAGEASAAGALPPALTERFRIESREADAIVDELSQDGGLRLDELPTGESRVERLAYARGMLRLGRPIEAEPVLEAILKEEPRFFPALADLGDGAVAMHEWADAREQLGRYLEYEPGDVRMRRHWAGASLRLEGHRDEAITVLEGMLASPESAPGAAQVLADWFIAEKRYAEAASALEKARALGDADLHNRYLLGFALTRLDRQEDARTIFEGIAETPSSLQPAAILQLVYLERSAENFVRALEHYERLVRGNFDWYLRENGIERIEKLGQTLRKELEAGQRLSVPVKELHARFRRPGPPGPRAEAFALLQQGVQEGKIEAEALIADLRYVYTNPEETTEMRANALQQLARFDRSFLPQEALCADAGRVARAAGAEPALRMASLQLWLQREPNEAKRRELLAELRTWIANEAEDATMRLFALRVLLELDDRTADTLRAGLRAEDGRVRRKSLEFLVQVHAQAPQSEYVELAFRTLEREQDPSLFATMHEQLAKLTGKPVLLPFEAEKTAEGRRDAVRTWARELGLAPGAPGEGQPGEGQPGEGTKAPEKKDG